MTNPKNSTGSTNAVTEATPNPSQRPKLKLTPRQSLFVKHYVATLNARESAKRAGYSAKTAHVQGTQLLKVPAIAWAIERHANKVTARLEFDSASVLEKLWQIAATDVNELIQVKIGACRYCYGKNFEYLETPHENRLRRAEYAKNLPHWEKQKLRAPDTFEIPAFDERGGVGFDRTQPPNGQCPECNGLGANYIVMADTSTLSPAAKALYMGARETSSGIELRIAQREKALELLGQHFGLWKTVAPPAAPTFNQQNNLYGLTTAQLYEILGRGPGAQSGGGGNSAPAISEG